MSSVLACPNCRSPITIEDSATPYQAACPTCRSLVAIRAVAPTDLTSSGEIQKDPNLTSSFEISTSGVRGTGELRRNRKRKKRRKQKKGWILLGTALVLIVLLEAGIFYWQWRLDEAETAARNHDIAQRNAEQDTRMAEQVRRTAEVSLLHNRVISLEQEISFWMDKDFYVPRPLSMQAESKELRQKFDDQEKELDKKYGYGHPGLSALNKDLADALDILQNQTRLATKRQLESAYRSVLNEMSLSSNQDRKVEIFQAWALRAHTAIQADITPLEKAFRQAVDSVR